MLPVVSTAITTSAFWGSASRWSVFSIVCEPPRTRVRDVVPGVRLSPAAAGNDAIAPTSITAVNALARRNSMPSVPSPKDAA